MLTTITAILPSVLALLTVILGIVLILVRSRYDKSVEKTGADSDKSVALRTADEVLTKAYNMLPGLISFSETMNSDKPGAIKKEFVLNYIKNTFNMMNVELDEVSLTAISNAIDEIVKVTKTLHTGSK